VHAGRHEPRPVGGLSESSESLEAVSSGTCHKVPKAAVLGMNSPITIKQEHDQRTADNTLPAAGAENTFALGCTCDGCACDPGSDCCATPTEDVM